jgi:hypothetical protein
VSRSIDSDEGATHLARLLIEDVIKARREVATGASQAARRNLVRTTFAAIEGLVWLAREHVHEVAEKMHVLTPTASMALREKSYFVADNGELVEQIRFVTLRAMIRLIAKQTALIAPGFTLMYTHPGWQKLQEATAIRNCITHPKNASELIVNERMLADVEAGFTWTAASMEHVIASSIASFRGHVEETRAVINALKTGDQTTTDEYQKAASQSD